MKIGKAKELAAKILNCGKRRIAIDSGKIKEVKEAITREDVKALIKSRIIRKTQGNFQSGARALELRKKKKKGRKKGIGKRKGTRKVRINKKKQWQQKVRALRKRLKKLKEEKKESVNKIGYGKIYRMIKGNYFKGKNDLSRFVEEKRELVKNK